MDFKKFCEDESVHLHFLKEYRDILEKVLNDRTTPQYPCFQKNKIIIKNRSFYGDPDDPIKNDFENFKCSSFNTYKPYEDNTGVHTYCEKCDGRLSQEYLGSNISKSKKRIHSKKIIPEHLMGRVIRQKSSSESEDSDDSVEPKMLYKITFKTKDDQGSGTSAPVHIRLIGNTIKSEPILLSKKCGSLKFYFAPGSKETFYVKSIILPALKGVNIKLDATEVKDEWFADWLSIEELGGEKRKWFCKIDRWLSSWREKCQLIANLKPEANLIANISYMIKVFTSNDSVDEFSGQLSIELYGSERKSDKEILTINNKQKNIKKGSSETYQIKSKEVGKIKAIRIAVEETPDPFESKHSQFLAKDNKLKSSQPIEDKRKGWKDIKIDKISISWIGSDKENHAIEFLMNDWIGLSHKMKKKSLYMKEPLDLSNSLKKISQLTKNKEENTYDVTFYTGKNTFSGTDATVFLKFFGSYGVWSKSYDFVDYDKKKFESGSENSFRIKGPSVGSIEKVNVSHNNTGIASGWKLEKIVVIRHLTPLEICNTLEDLKRNSALPKEIKVMDGKVVKNEEDISLNRYPSNNSLRSSKNKLNLRNNRVNDSETSSEDDTESIEEPVMKVVKNNANNSKTNDKNKSRESLLTQLPYAEESRFVCSKWLEEKNKKKSVEQILDADSKKILFSPISLLLNMDK